jgi:hypothetical protein
MLINDFLSKYGNKYEYDYDEDIPDRLELIYNLEKNLMLQTVTVLENEERGSFSIYREFLYEDSDSPLLSLLKHQDEILFLQALSKISKCKPICCHEDGMGCPFFNINIGFASIDTDISNLIQKLEEIEEACKLSDNEELDSIYLKDNWSESLEEYLNQENKLFESLFKENQILDYKPIPDLEYPPKLWDKFSKSDRVYVNNENTVIFAYGEHLLKKAGFFDVKYEINETYAGLKYFFGVAQDKLIYVNNKYVEDISSIFERLDYDNDYKPSYYTNFTSVMLIKYSNLWAVISLLKNDKFELYLNEEKILIENMINSFNKFISTKIDLSGFTIGSYNKKSYYDMSTLDESEFEKLCRDLLIDQNFNNVVIRGDTRAPDGGVDIEASEEYKTLLETEKRHWIFQCKHTKSQINRKDLSEIEHLLDEFNADCYGIFYSNIFTPDTLDRIKTLSKKYKIVYWDRNSLEVLLNKYPNTAHRYFSF